MSMPGVAGDSLTRILERQTVNFNLCSDPAACRCEVTGEVVFGQSCGAACLAEIVAGQEPQLPLAELRLRNAGVEPAPTARLEVRLDQAGYRLDLQERANCETGAGPNITQCYLLLPNKTDTNLPLHISASQTGAGAGGVSGVQHLTLSVTVSSDCQGSPQTNIQTEFQIPVVQKWELVPSQDKTQQAEEFYWNKEEDNEETRPISLEYAVTNTGPSRSSLADVFVFIPRHPLLENQEITLDSQQCSAGNFEDVGSLLAPPTAKAGDIACKVRGSCLLYRCPVSSSLKKSERKVVKVSYDFNMKKAEQRNEETKFVVRTSLCVLKRDQFQPDHIVCDASNTTITTTTVFQYFQPSALDVLIDYWQIVVGAGAAIIVFIVILLLAWKFDLFRRARIVKNKDDENSFMDENPNEQVEMK